MTFAVGGRTGLGAFYNLEFTGVRSDGKTRNVIDTTVGFVAGSNESVSIERKNLICLPSGAWSKLQTRSLSEIGPSAHPCSESAPPRRPRTR